MNHCELAHDWHKQGYSCAQSVVAAFEDVLPLCAHQVMDVSSGFGAGAGTGELCGSITGGLMVLGLTHPVNHDDPVASKLRTLEYSKALQGRFQETFGHLRCEDLLADPLATWEKHPLVAALALEKPCQLMVVLTAQVVEEMLQEEGLL